jgi:glycosyltransferase involved in cell wall biosynthesis
MKIAFIAAGAAGMYCGSCLRDNALASALVDLGEDIVLVPTYTPLRLDERAVGVDHVFFGAIDVYLHEKFPWLRKPRGLVGKMLGSQRLLRFVSRFALGANPRELGRLTVSTLRGEAGNQRRLLTELIDWLSREVQPDVVHLSSSLFSGFARDLKRRLRVPVVCGLQGEDLFLESLPEPFRSESLSLLRERSVDIDRYNATSTHEADRMASWVGLDRAKVDVVLPGIHLGQYESPPSRADASRPLTIGYFARIAPEKGLHLLCDAFHILCESGEFPDLRLQAAGYLGGKDLRYAGHVRRILASRGIARRVEIFGTVDREAKLAFFREVDVLSVPTVFPEPKGIFILEALASGVPVVQPAHGSFPELVAATGGGLLHEPRSAEDLARKLAEILRNAELRRELGAKGREAVHARFSSRRMAEETLSIYRKLATNGVS